MNRPICLIGGFNMAEKWVEENTKTEEFLVLNQEATIDEIKTFNHFLNTSSLNKKVGVIYFFNNLNESKQSVFLKIFEDLPNFSRVIIHASSFVTFTIQTRCDLFFLKKNAELSKDLLWIFKFFNECLVSKSFNRNVRNALITYLETLNLKENGFLSDDEKNCILRDLV